MPGLEKNVDNIVVRRNSKEAEGWQAAVQVLKKYLLDPDIMANGRKDDWIGSEARLQMETLSPSPRVSLDTLSASPSSTQQGLASAGSTGGE